MMAIYQGARARVVVPGARVRGLRRRDDWPRDTDGGRTTVRFPGRRAAVPIERRRRRVTTRARRSVRPAAGLLAVIAAALLFGLVHLTYTLQGAAVRHGIDGSLQERAQLLREIQSQEGVIAHWGSEPQVVDWAQQYGLDRLGSTVHVPSR